MIWEQFLTRVGDAPDRPAVCVGDRVISYLELAGMAETLAARFSPTENDQPRRALIKQSEPLSILLCLLACWRDGVIPVLMRENATSAQMDELIASLRPEVLLTTPLGTDQLSPRTPVLGNARHCGPRDEALVISTSGTTGNPRLVALPAEAVCINAAAIGASLKLIREDRIAVNTPLTYMYGLMGGTIAGLWAGATVHLFSPRMPLPLAQAGIRKHSITVVQGPPSLMRLFVAYWNNQPFPSVRIVTVGGEVLRPDLADDLERAFPQARKILLYGMTEAGPRISHDDISSGRYVRNCVGKPYEHIEWRVDPVNNPDVPAHIGRLALRGPSIFLGYLQTTGTYAGLDADGFYRSSDLVSKDDSGRLCFHGRLDRMFKSGGKLVNPAAVESILAQHPGVAQVRCFAELHDILGFAPVADVVAKADECITESALRKHCEAHLDSHAVPRQLRLVSSLPVAHSGKAESSHAAPPLL